MVATMFGHRVPSCFLECYDQRKERLDPIKFYLYRRAQRNELERNDYLKIIAACEMDARDEEKEQAKSSGKKKKVAGAKRKYETSSRRIYRDPTDGSIKEFGPRDTEWFRMYVADPDNDSAKFRKKFRRRFRCSYESYTKHLQEVKSSGLFKAWGDGVRNHAGKESSPIELLVLGALRYIGRGWCFDDLEENTCISEETHRKFMHIYLFWGSTTLYENHVILPENGKQAQEWAEEYKMAGFPGCISSGDATHIGMLKCFYQLKQHNASYKLKMPSRTYNTHVNHRRRILHSTPGHPGRWNDISLQLFDTFAKTMRHGDTYNDLVFELKERTTDGDTKAVYYRGVWEIVDNGYLPWPTMVPPSKFYCTYAEMRFSKWIESLRKDVECTFGIMKGRFRILKTGIPLHGIEVCDRVWLTCCALHNFFLVEDGLDEKWDVSNYLSDEGAHEEEDIRRYCNLDASGVGPGNDVPLGHSAELWPVAESEGMNIEEDGSDEDNAIPVSKLSLVLFKSKLIEHFDILWKQNKIKWPSRTGSDPPPPIFEH